MPSSAQRARAEGIVSRTAPVVVKRPSTGPRLSARSWPVSLQGTCPVAAGPIPKPSRQYINDSSQASVGRCPRPPVPRQARDRPRPCSALLVAIFPFLRAPDLVLRRRLRPPFALVTSRAAANSVRRLPPAGSAVRKRPEGLDQEAEDPGSLRAALSGEHLARSHNWSPVGSEVHHATDRVVYLWREAPPCTGLSPSGPPSWRQRSSSSPTRSH